MTRTARIFVHLLLAAGVHAAFGQRWLPGIELNLGWVKASGTTSDYYWLGGYFPEEDRDPNTGIITGGVWYACELQWAGAAGVGATYPRGGFLSGVVSFDLALPRYAASRTQYPGAHRSRSEYTVDVHGYMASGALGVRIYPLGRRPGLYMEVLAGRTYSRLDLRWSPVFPANAVGAYYDAYIRVRSTEGFGAVAIGLLRRVGGVWSLQAKVRWRPPELYDYELLEGYLGLVWGG